MTVFTGHDRSLVVEGHLVVIFDGCELFVGDLQGAFREIIDLQKKPSRGTWDVPSNRVSKAFITQGLILTCKVPLRSPL